MEWTWTILDGGPFDGDECEMGGGFPEYLRVWAVGRREAIWRKESAQNWPSYAARYALKQTATEPVTYVYDGVGDGGPDKVEREAVHHHRQEIQEPEPVTAEGGLTIGSYAEFEAAFGPSPWAEFIEEFDGQL